MMRKHTLFAALSLLSTFLLNPSQSEIDNGPNQRSLEKVLLPNGSECSESSQCESGCCVWNPFANEVCDDDEWYRDCMEEDFTFIQNELDTCAGSETDVSENDQQTMKIMSYNLYLILMASDGITSLDDRANRITEWFAQPPGNNYDIVALQETWISSDIIRDGMAAAGYCHYVYDDRGTLGSGLALYSKFPIVEHDFRGFQNACKGTDCAVDKGVLYTKIDRYGKMINVFNTHTMFSVDNHETRRRQYNVIRGFIDEQDIESEPVFIVGDFNEDKVNTPEMYENMLSDLNAGEFATVPNTTPYSYDPETNGLIDPHSPGAGGTRRALDYILYDKTGLSEEMIPTFCEYILPKDENGNDLSDHYPMSCDVSFNGISAMSAAASSSGAIRASPYLFALGFALVGGVFGLVPGRI